jgi:hypothetical protein
VRCIDLLRTALQDELEDVHPARLAAVWRAVTGVVLGGQLWLSALGRALPGATSDKHRIKAVDRLLGNTKLHREMDGFYRASASRLLRGIETPIVAVDWTGLGANKYEISAKLCSDGRALPLYSRVFPKQSVATQQAHRQFLRGLSNALPDHCKPVLVTDAGFHCGWFRDVVAYGWDYVGRVRGRTQACFDQRWYSVQELYRWARNRPQNLGQATMPRVKPSTHRLVLSKRPVLQGRKRLTRRGTPGQRTTDVKAAKAAREPWLLATSLSCNPKGVVQIYGLRMQIEESFRDRKSHRNGWSMHLASSPSCERMNVLCLLASLAELAVQVVGRAVAGTVTAHQFQANTVRKRRVLSFFFLGCRAIQCEVPVSVQRLRAASQSLIATIAWNARLAA